MTVLDDIRSRPDDETKYTPTAPGSFSRGKNRMQHWIEPGGVFSPAQGRYHFFVNYGCGWCHQIMLARALKGLENTLSLSHTGPKVGTRGTPTYKGYSVDDATGHGFTSVFDVYNSNAEYGTEQMTIPILFDKETARTVSNDPAQMLFMINFMFDEWATESIDLYPTVLAPQIEAMNDIIFPGINDGVYRCWFGSEQAYGDAFTALTEALQYVEQTLSSSPYLCGKTATLADIRAFPHLFRFDVIYHQLMLREPRGPKLDSFPCILAWLERMYMLPRIAACCDLPVATKFYLGATSEESDRIYLQNKYSWMPTLEQLASKREAEAMPSAL